MMVTAVPTGPLGGLKLRICGVTRNFLLLVSVPPGVVTVTEPVVAPVGTSAVRAPYELLKNAASLGKAKSRWRVTSKHGMFAGHCNGSIQHALIQALGQLLGLF